MEIHMWVHVNHMWITWEIMEITCESHGRLGKSHVNHMAHDENHMRITWDHMWITWEHMRITCEHMGITCETHVIFMCFFRKGINPVFIKNLSFVNVSVIRNFLNIAFANSERWLAKSRVYIILCQHGKFSNISTLLLKPFVLNFEKNNYKTFYLYWFTVISALMEIEKNSKM